MVATMQITTQNGTPMNVVRCNDTVTFYDARFPSFGKYGQHIALYYIDTMLKSKGGLCTWGGIPAWDIDAINMHKVREWLKSEEV